MPDLILPVLIDWLILIWNVMMLHWCDKDEVQQQDGPIYGMYRLETQQIWGFGRNSYITIMCSNITCFDESSHWKTSFIKIPSPNTGTGWFSWWIRSMALCIDHHWRRQNVIFCLWSENVFILHQLVIYNNDFQVWGARAGLINSLLLIKRIISSLK